MKSAEKKQTVLFICSYGAISGGTIVIFEHAYRLKLEGFEVSLAFKYVEPGFDPIVFPHSQDVSLIDYETDKHFDFVVATFWSTFYDLSAFQSKNYVYFCQCDERLFYREDNTDRDWAALTYSISAMHAVAPAKFLATKLGDEFGINCHYVPNGTDVSLFSNQNREKSDKVIVLIEGPGKAWFKRVDDAFQVTHGISNIEIRYVTYDGYVAPDWKSDKVFKKVPYYQMPEIYQSCDILIKMSEVESFGLPNLEMMACGGAVITTAFTGHEEYAIDGKNSFVVPIGDVEAARIKVLELIANPELRKKFGENGIKTAQARDWNILKPDFADALEKIERSYPQGNAQRVLTKLKPLSRAYHEYESTLHKLQYLENWKLGVIEREKTIPFRIAHRVLNLIK